MLDRHDIETVSFCRSSIMGANSVFCDLVRPHQREYGGVNLALWCY